MGSVDPGGPVALSSELNQTHLHKLIKVFRTQVGIYSSGLEINYAGQRPPGSVFPTPAPKA